MQVTHVFVWLFHIRILVKFSLKMTVNMQDCYGENRRVDTRGQLAVFAEVPSLCACIYAYILCEKIFYNANKLAIYTVFPVIQAFFSLI